MDSIKLHQLVLNPQKVSERNLSELQQLIQNYPYFQAAYFLVAKAKPSKENIGRASIRTSQRSVLKNAILNKNLSQQEWVKPNMPDFHPEENINAFEKLSEENQEKLNLFTDQKNILEANTDLDLNIDDTPILNGSDSEDNTTEDPHYTLNENTNLEETNCEEPKYKEENESKEEPDEPQITTNTIEEIDINESDDYKDPHEDARNELLETLANFEKNKKNITKQYKFDTNEDSNNDDIHEPEKELENTISINDKDQINTPKSGFKTKKKPKPQKNNIEKRITLDDSYFDLNNYLDDEIVQPDKKKSLEKDKNIHQKQGIIIDSFVKNMPRMPSTSIEYVQENKIDLSIESVREDQELFSEQLALIYQKQKKIKKAIYVYEKLILKYPNKKTYFTLQIEKLKNNI